MEYIFQGYIVVAVLLLGASLVFTEVEPRGSDSMFFACLFWPVIIVGLAAFWLSEMIRGEANN